jgi:hypothetical protein
MAAAVARADKTCMRLLLPILGALVLVPAALSAEPRAHTIAGTISANSGTSITVTAGDRSVTCVVLGAKAQAAIARWGVGVKAGMACRQIGERLLLYRLTRIGSKEGTSTPPTTTTPSPTHSDARGKVSALGGGSITVTRTDGTSLTCSVTDGQARSIADGAPVGTVVLLVCSGTGERPALVSLQRLETTTTPPTTTPTPTPTNTDRRYAKGVVTALSSDGVTVKPDEGGDSLQCRITTASDSASAATRLSVGAHVGIVCRRDGDSWVLAGSTSIS